MTESFINKTNRIGWIYIVAHKKTGLIKIGITERPQQRMNELQNPQVLKLLTIQKYIEREKFLHAEFADYRLPQSEWFHLSPAQLACACEMVDKWHREIENISINSTNYESIYITNPHNDKTLQKEESHSTEAQHKASYSKDSNELDHFYWESQLKRLGKRGASWGP
jgi:T5orf172 domain